MFLILFFLLIGHWAPVIKQAHFLFFFRFWKCVCFTLDWQNFELWFLSPKAVYFVCRFWISRSVRHYSRSKRTDWTSGGSREKWRTGRCDTVEYNLCSLSLLWPSSETIIKKVFLLVRIPKQLIILTLNFFVVYFPSQYQWFFPFVTFWEIVPDIWLAGFENVRIYCFSLKWSYWGVTF